MNNRVGLANKRELDDYHDVFSSITVKDLTESIDRFHPRLIYEDLSPSKGTWK